MKNLKNTRSSLHALGVKRNRELERQLLEETGEKADALRKRFWELVEVKAQNECWIWKQHVSSNGYGQFHIKGIPFKPHRIAYIFHYCKEIPWGYYMCHSCDNKACVNPLHLWPGTNKDNQLDNVIKGKNYSPKGELAPSCKLTANKVLEIRKLHSEGMVQRRIAEKFNIGYKAICKIVLRQRWKHI